MKIYVKFDFNVTSKAILKEQLEKLELLHDIHGVGEIELKQKLTGDQKKSLTEALEKYGIEILDNQKMELVERIKDAINEMLSDQKAPLYKVSSYLADKLDYSYPHLSALFSEATHTSIENYVILKKLDQAKELMAQTDLSLTDIAFRLNYSSVAHLSGQFKKTTGLTPSVFQKIVKFRKTKTNL
jgi:AraC-like DNA-binding protein